MPWGTLDRRGVPRGRADRGAPRLDRRRVPGAPHRRRLRATLRALIEARAPLDLIALASRFPLDEMVHVELCARMAMELGGGTEILHDPLDDDRSTRTPAQSPLHARGGAGRALLLRRRGALDPAAARHLARGAPPAAARGARRIVQRRGRARRPSASRSSTGRSPSCPSGRARALGAAADRGDRGRCAAQWADIESRAAARACEVDALAWMETDAYLALAARSMDEKVLRPCARAAFR